MDYDEILGDAVGLLPRNVEHADHVSSDAALARYLSLPAERQRDDFWLDCGEYWLSEYQSSRGERLPFMANFIVHLDSVSSEVTRVEVIEYFPTVIAGEKFGFAYGAFLPSFIPDIRRVPPTTRDRLVVLNQILHLSEVPVKARK